MISSSIPGSFKPFQASGLDGTPCPTEYVGVRILGDSRYRYTLIEIRRPSSQVALGISLGIMKSMNMSKQRPNSHAILCISLTYKIERPKLQQEITICYGDS